MNKINIKKRVLSPLKLLTIKNAPRQKKKTKRWNHDARILKRVWFDCCVSDPHMLVKKISVHE